MRVLLIAAALTLASCGSPPPAQNAAAPAETGCNKTVSRTIAFTGADAADIVETRALGDDCKSAVALITIRKASGEPLWAWATHSPWLGGEATDASVDAFLKGWANVKVDTTAALPDWPERDRVFKDDLGPFMHTPLDRGTYLDVRARALPRLCYATGVESGLCIYYDSNSGTVAEIFRSGA